MAEDGLMQKVTGFQKITRMFKEHDERGDRAYSRGVRKFGLFIFAKMQKRVPVDKGVLKASGFVRSEGAGRDTKVFVGYTAGYAVFVHENLDAAHGAEFNAKHAEAIAAGLEHTRGIGQRAKWIELEIRDPNNWAEGKRIMIEEFNNR